MIGQMISNHLSRVDGDQVLGASPGCSWDSFSHVRRRLPLPNSTNSFLRPISGCACLYRWLDGINLIRFDVHQADYLRRDELPYAVERLDKENRSRALV